MDIITEFKQQELNRGCGLNVAILLIVFLLCLASCRSYQPEVVHREHHFEADSMAVQAQVDRRIKVWHQKLDSAWSERVDSYSVAWQSREDEREIVTETVTTATDSLGRELRTEQRRTERIISQHQQQLEQRIYKEIDGRISKAIDSVNNLWLQRFESHANSVQQQDSVFQEKRHTDTQNHNRGIYAFVLGIGLFVALFFGYRFGKP